MPEFSFRLQLVMRRFMVSITRLQVADRLYVSYPNALEDLRIIFATIKIILLPEPTEGVDERQITASGEYWMKL